MSEATFSVKNFDKYQHYRDRNPPWIKFHHATLGDYEFNRLPDAVKWHLVGIWSLASQHNNCLPFDSAWIQQRIGAVERVDLNALAEAGWLLVQHASKTGARRQRKATSETEAQEQAEEEKIPPAPTEPAPMGDRDKARALGEAVAAERRAKDAALKADFDEFWRHYPRRVGKGAAERAYAAARRRPPVPSASDMLAGCMRYAAARAGEDPQYTAHAATWLNAGRWQDEPETGGTNGPGTRHIRADRISPETAAAARFLDRQHRPVERAGGLPDRMAEARKTPAWHGPDIGDLDSEDGGGAGADGAVRADEDGAGPPAVAIAGAAGR